MRITWTDLGAFRCFWFYQNLTGLRELNIWCYTFMRRHMVLITKMSKLYRLINQYMLFTQYSLKIKFIISCKEQLVHRVDWEWELALSLRTRPYICTWEWQVNQVWYVPRYVRPWDYNIVCTIIKYNLMANKEKQVINKSWLKHTFCKVKIVWDHYGFPKIKLGRHYLGIPNLCKLNNAQPSV